MPRPMPLVEPVTLTAVPFSILRPLLPGAAALGSTGQVAGPVVSAAAGDEARAALEGHVGPEPGQGDDDAIAQADQEIDVDEAPKQPGEPSGQLDKTEIGDRCLTADGREAAAVAVAKRPWWRTAVDPRADHLRHEGTLLVGDRRDARESLACSVQSVAGVPDDEDVGMIAKTEIEADLDTPRPVRGNGEPARDRRRGDTGRP